MSQLNSFARAQNPDFVYFDIVNTNAKSSTSDLPDLRFVETRATPIIANTGDYRMSIVRFSVDTPNLPVLIVQPRQGSIFYTIYEVAVNVRTRTNTPLIAPNPIVLTGISYALKWIPDDETAQEPATAPNKFTALTPYYWCHSYHWFLDIVNNYLKRAHDATLSAWQSSVGLPTIEYDWMLVPPRFEWDSAAQAPILYATNFYNKANFPFACNFSSIGPTLQTSPTGFAPFPPLFEIAMNGPLHALFSGFASHPINYKPAVISPPSVGPPSTQWFGLVVDNTNMDGHAWRVQSTETSLITSTNPGHNNSIQIPYLPPTNTTSGPAGGTQIFPAYSAQYRDPYYGIIIRQASEVACTELWTPIAAIVFTSNLLPIVPNQLSNPIVYNEGIILSQAADNNFAQIITDLASNEYGYRCNVLFTPSAEFRRIELTGNTPLTNLDVNVFWRSKFGELIPFKLSSGASASIKFLFERKPNIRDRFASMDLD